MSDTVFFNIGYVPADHRGGCISCGDPKSSGTKEATLVIDQGTLHITSMEIQDFHYDGMKANFFSPKDELYKAIAESVNNYFNVSRKIDEFTIASAWAFFQDEPLKKSKIEPIDWDFGEFKNDGKKYNGKFYFRFTEQVGDDYTRELLAFLAK